MRTGLYGALTMCLSLCMLEATLSRGYNYFLFFTDGETRAQRWEVIHQGHSACWWQIRGSEPRCVPLPLALIYLEDSFPQPGGRPESREEARGRDSQEFKLAELVGEGGSAWEWPVVRAWATGPSVCGMLGEGGAAGQVQTLLSQRRPRVSRGRRLAGGWGWGQ